MKNRSDQQRLLDDVLAESLPPDFRAALLGGTLRLAHRRRRWRQVRQTGGVLAVAVLGAMFVWQNRPEKISIPKSVAKAPMESSYRLIETQPLPAGAVVATGSFSSAKMISSASTVAQVTTMDGAFHLINDEQLLALVGPRPAILIRTGPRSEELVFANPEDQKGFPLN